MWIIWDVDQVKRSNLLNLSFYFADPEGNGLEVFWDTPWHVSQPSGVVWDSNLDETAALAWVEATFNQDTEFALREDAQGKFVNRTS